jgi:hypothetical protein
VSFGFDDDDGCSMVARGSGGGPLWPLMAAWVLVLGRRRAQRLE